jgi:hypothetical protein
VTAYDQDGLFADAGFIWRPSRRSELQLRAGINDDGDPIVAGSAAFQIGRFFGFSFTLYDDDETFGTSLTKNLRDLPGEFKIEHDLLSGGLAPGCVFDEQTPGQGRVPEPRAAVAHRRLLSRPRRQHALLGQRPAVELGRRRHLHAARLLPAGQPHFR